MGATSVMRIVKYNIATYLMHQYVRVYAHYITLLIHRVRYGLRNSIPSFRGFVD